MRSLRASNCLARPTSNRDHVGATDVSFSAQREEMCRVGRSLFERGYVHASAGNISVRLPGAQGFLITPTDACLGFLSADDLAHTDIEGRQLSGAPSSKTLALHRSIYSAEPAAHCVIHTHSTHLVALTLAGVWSKADILPPITPYFVMKVGHVPLIRYHRPGDPAVAELVAEAIATARIGGAPIRAVMLDRLGPNVWHDSPATAMAVLEELEETARLWMMTGRESAPLTDAQIFDLRSTFNARW
jgi:ribulose-5-phosphate 4-epimerase/fuculose-1-phosphate aldolase